LSRRRGAELKAQDEIVITVGTHLEGPRASFHIAQAPVEGDGIGVSSIDTKQQATRAPPASLGLRRPHQTASKAAALVTMQGIHTLHLKVGVRDIRQGQVGLCQHQIGHGGGARLRLREPDASKAVRKPLRVLARRMLDLAMLKDVGTRKHARKGLKEACLPDEGQGLLIAGDTGTKIDGGGLLCLHSCITNNEGKSWQRFRLRPHWASPMKAPRLPARLLLLLGLLLSGCAPKDPLQRSIRASSPSEFNSWREGSGLQGPQDEALTLCVQELKLSIQAAQLASGAEEVQDYLLATIDQAKVSDFLRWGLQTRYERIRRLRDEWDAGLKKGLERIAKGTIKLDDASQRAQIDDARNHMALHEAEMKRTTELAASIGLTVDTELKSAPASDLRALLHPKN